MGQNWVLLQMDGLVAKHDQHLWSSGPSILSDDIHIITACIPKYQHVHG